MTKFGNNCVFVAVQFGDKANFTGAGFGDNINFTHAKFGEGANFIIGESNSLQSITFALAKFGANASFAGRRLNGCLDLSQCQFAGPPDLSGLTNPERLNTTGIRVGLGDWVWWQRNWTSDSGTITAVRRLRKLAAEIHHNGWERDLFILERQAERGNLWAALWDACFAPKVEVLLFQRTLTDFGKWQTLRLFWRAAAQTVLVGLYGLLSDFGRSLVRPLFWLAVTQVVFYGWYAATAGKAGFWAEVWNAVLLRTDNQIFSFTLAQAFPFLPGAKKATEDYITRLGVDALPLCLQVGPLFHGVLSALFVFLALLALRNFFKVK